MIDYSAHMDAPELIALCLSCKYDDCIGICDDYKNVARELMGVLKLKDKSKRYLIPGEKFEAFGESHTLKEWAKISGISYQTLYKRIITYGWETEKSLREPQIFGPRARTITVDGVAASIKEHSQRYAVPEATIRDRLTRGWTEQEAVYGRNKSHDNE